MTEQEKNIIKNEIMDALLYGSKTIDQLTLSSDISDADLFEISGGRAITYSTLRAAIAASITNGGISGSGHTHTNKDSLDQIATDSDGYIHLTYPKRVLNEATKEYETIITTEKVKAGYADKAGDLSDDSPVLKLINTIGNQFVPTYLDGSTYVDTTWAEIVAGTRTLAAIKSVKGFFSDSFISARGANSAGGGSTGGAYYLYELIDTAISNPSSGQALVYNGSKWVNSTVEQNEYILPAASASTLGGVKVGATLAMASGVLDQKAGIVSEGVYPKVTVDTYGRVTAGELLAASDIPNLPWSKITSGTPTTIAGYGITDTYTKTDADNRFVQQSLFDSMFAKESDGNGGFRIKAKYGLYSDEFISARGMNPDGGGSGSGGVYYLHELLDAAINNPTSGQALVYNGTKWVNQAIPTGLDETALASYLTTHNYATQQWVESKGYLTTHQSLANYVTLNTPQNITANKVFYGEERFVANGLTYTDPWSGIVCAIKVTGKVGITDSIKAASFIKSNGTASQFLKADGSVDGNAYLTTASAAATYVSKAGDTMTGALRMGQSVASAPASQPMALSYGRLQCYGTLNINGNTDNSGNEFVNITAGHGLSASTADGLSIGTNTLTWQNQTVWHAGNDGAGSGLDADLLDGLHASSFVLDYGGEFSGKIYSLPCKSIFSGNNLSDAPVSGWVSGLVLGANWNNNHYQHYLVESNNGRWYTTRQSSNGSMTNWNTLAYLTDNVASATKLQTARTIWGQSFNGTANVSGSLTGVSSIGFNGNYEFGIHNGRYVFGTTGQVGAVGANVGSLLVSNMWADATKVPTNGIYVKGGLRIGDITLSYDAANGGLHVSGGGLYADSYISGRGVNTSGSGSSGGGLIQQVYGSSSLGGVFSDTTLTDTFNAYTINKIRTDLMSADSALSGRVTSLEGGAAVSVTTTGSGNAITAISKSGTTITATKGATFLTAHQSLANYVPWSKQSLATVNGTNHNPQFFNIENENLIANYKNYWSVINLGSYSGNNFRSQIAMPYQDSITDTDMFIRTANGSNWRAWRRVLHDGNYSSILDARYYTESEINTKLGNYVTLNTTQTITGLKTFSAASTTAIFNSTGTTATNVVLKTNGTQRSSIGWYNNFVFISNEPSYTGASTDKYHRLGITDAGVPQFWTNRDSSKYTLLHEGNYTSILDSRYVNVTGDTMTGLLSVTRIGNFVGDFDEGIRVHSCGQHSWAAVVLCGTDNTGDSGTSANTWGIFAHDGAFGIGRNGNGITAGTARLWCDTSNVWRVNGTNVLLHGGNYSSVLDSRYYTESEADARFVNVTGDTMTGLLTAKVAGSHTGIKLGNTYLTAIDGNVIFQNNAEIRFGADAWDYNVWAGLKYASSSKTIYLGLADKNIFTANAAQTGGSILTPGISNIYVGNNTTNKVWHAGNDGSGSGLNADYLDGYHESAFLRQGVGRLSTTAAFDIRRTCTNELYNYNPYSFDEEYGTIVTFSSGGVNFAGQFYLPRLGGSHISYRGKNDTNNTWAAWSKLAFLTDNVASATKLQTARTLWGQSFNGTANVDGALTVHHTGACGVYISGGGESSYSCQASGGLRWVSGAYPDRYFIWDSSGNGNERLTILNNGSVGIGTISPSAKLDVIGVIHSTAGMWSNGYVSARGQNTASDARLKNILQTKLLDTRSIAAAPSVLFRWKDDGREDVGSIAQYWQRIDRHLVSHRPDGYLGLDYGKAALLSVISVAKQTLNHEERIKALERENALLKKQIKSLT